MALQSITLCLILFITQPIHHVQSFATYTNGEVGKIKSSLQSHIESIRCKNFGGMINGDREKGRGQTQDDIVINLGNERNLVAITGESGSGKSLLIAKVIDYLMGCKASPTILPSTDEANYAAIKVGKCLSASSPLRNTLNS